MYLLVTLTRFNCTGVEMVSQFNAEVDRSCWFGALPRDDQQGTARRRSGNGPMNSQLPQHLRVHEFATFVRTLPSQPKRSSGGNTMASHEHMEIVRAGRDAIEHWQEEHRFENLDLCGANLKESILQNADLTGANLKVANLQSANLRQANLSWADLRKARLRNAELGGADLHQAQLQESDLRGAVLRRANLLGIKLHGANLQGTDLRRASLDQASLQEASLAGARLDFLQRLTLWWNASRVSSDQN